MLWAEDVALNVMPGSEGSAVFVECGELRLVETEEIPVLFGDDVEGLITAEARKFQPTVEDVDVGLDDLETGLGKFRAIFIAGLAPISVR
jgi:hypothetical protein